MIDFYGLKTCDTCKKALRDLKEEKQDVVVHDLRADGVTTKQIEAWAKTVGWERLLNKSSTTWRGLDEAEKENLDASKAVALMAAHPTLIKRPVIEAGGAVHVGWTEATKKAVL